MKKIIVLLISISTISMAAPKVLTDIVAHAKMKLKVGFFLNASDTQIGGEIFAMVGTTVFPSVYFDIEDKTNLNKTIVIYMPHEIIIPGKNKGRVILGKELKVVSKYLSGTNSTRNTNGYMEGTVDMKNGKGRVEVSLETVISDDNKVTGVDSFDFPAFTVGINQR